MKQILLDKIGITASLLCAIHCSLIPVILSAGLLSGLNWMRSHWVDYVFISIAGIIALWAFSKARRHHHSSQPIYIAAFGFILMLVGLSVGHGNWSELVLMTTGGIMIAIAHAFNIKLSRACVHCNHH